MSRWRAALVVLAGCGRVGFDADGGRQPDAPPADAFVGRWSLLQVVSNETDDTISWNQSTSAGSVLVVAFNLPPGVVVTGLHDDANNSYSRIAAASASDSQGPVEVWYAMNQGDSGDIHLDYTGATPNAQVAWEVSGLTGQIDAVAALSDQASTTTPTSAPLTTSRPGDFVISVVKTDVIQTLTSPAFTLDSVIRDDGYAHLTANTGAAGTYQPTWTSDPAMYCTSSVAFVSQ